MIFDVKNTIRFHIHKGDTHYIAEGIDLPIVTQGKTLDELVANLREALALQLDGENLAAFDIAPNASIIADIELEAVMHAKT